MANKIAWSTNARSHVIFYDFQLSPKINAVNTVKMCQLVEN